MRGVASIRVRPGGTLTPLAETPIIRAYPGEAPPSSSGLGHSVLSRRTGVRLPLGVLARTARLRTRQNRSEIPGDFAFPMSVLGRLDFHQTIHWSAPMAYTEEELRKALKAFKKRLKSTQLDDDSRLGHGPMSSGGQGKIVSMQPPAGFG